jgi:hypothetical protein
MDYEVCEICKSIWSDNLFQICVVSTVSAQKCSIINDLTQNRCITYGCLAQLITFVDNLDNANNSEASSSKGGCRSGTEIFADVLRQIEGASLGMSLNSLMLKDKIPEMKNIKRCLQTNQSRQKANWCCLKADIIYSKKKPDQ